MKRSIGWLLPEADRARLRALFPATYDVDQTIQHHVTLHFMVDVSEPLPTARRGTVVGRAARDGVEALVVEIDGNTLRPDGEILHITWSLDHAADRRPRHSKDLLRAGWDEVPPIPISLLPTVLDFRPSNESQTLLNSPR